MKKMLIILFVLCFGIYIRQTTAFAAETDQTTAVNSVAENVSGSAVASGTATATAQPLEEVILFDGLDEFSGPVSASLEDLELPGTSIARVGQTVKDKTGNWYKITNTGKKRTVKFMQGKKAKKITIPATISIRGKSYKVTSIAANAMQKDNLVTEVSVGKEVRQIGKSAFCQCKHLKKLTIKTDKLKAETVGKKAFAGLKKDTVILVCNKSKRKCYRAILNLNN